MRELARTVLLMRTSYGVNNLNDILSPRNCEKLVEAVKQIGQFDEATHTFRKPNLAKNIGAALQKCAEIKKVTDGLTDEKARKDADQFIDWFVASWGDFVSAVAKQSMQKVKFDKDNVLPTCQDIAALTKHVQEEGLAAQECDDYQTLAKSTMCEIVLFNRKRAGEIQRLKKAEYENRKKGQELHPAVAGSLSKFELHLVKSLLRIEVRGKLNRRTAILLTQNVTEKIDHLLQLQSKQGGKAAASPYVFATPEGDRPFRTCDVIWSYSQEAGVKNSALFRSTNLRKQVATMTQCLAISEGDQDLLAEFMGHDIRIHRKYYRLPMDILQKAKVAKVLLAANGQFQQREARNGDKTEETSEEEMDEEEEIHGEILQELSGAHEGANKRKRRRQEFAEHAPHEQTSCSSAKNEAKQEKMHTDASGDAPSSSVPVTDTKGRKTPKRKPWGPLEKEAVFRRFHMCFRVRRAPGKLEVEEVLQDEPALRNRTWLNIKDFISYRNRTVKI
ncbi:uncharacterized protein [Littorina saxatilis]|uniref:uncharacterized protein n=1 Tax=Littorina saxatilis TaxID=31220 RepID=UPI0038B5D544